MSVLLTANRRARSRRSGRHPAAPRRRQVKSVALIGLDVSRVPIRLQTRSWAPVVVAALVGALFLTSLRMDVIRMRFAVAESFEQELHFEELKRRLIVRMRELRDPATLSRRARELGFRRAEHQIDLREAGDWRDAPERPAESAALTIEIASAAVRLDGASPGRGH